MQRAVSYTHLDVYKRQILAYSALEGEDWISPVSKKMVLSEEDLLIDMAQTEGFVSDGDNTITVVLDTKLTPELIEEGLVREIISKVQTMRKEADFQVTDKIVISCKGNEKIEQLIKANADQIKSEVLAVDVKFDEANGYVKDWSINGENVTMGVERA